MTSGNRSPTRKQRFLAEKTVFSCAENDFFIGMGGICAQQLPSLSGRGWGWGLAATSHLAATTSFPLCTKGFWGDGGRVAAKIEKNFFSYVTRHIIAQQHSTAAATTQLIDSYETAHRHQRNSASTPTIRHSTDCTKYQKCAQSG